jgi:hypothetical protein
MTAKYKVWLEIELVDDDNDIYQNMQNSECLGEFEHLDDAVELLQGLVDVNNAFKRPIHISRKRHGNDKPSS